MKKYDCGQHYINPEIIEQWKQLTIAMQDKRKGSKAIRVYMKCLQNGKLELAEKIHAKYSQLFPHDDLVMAFGLNMLVKRK